MASMASTLTTSTMSPPSPPPSMLAPGKKREGDISDSFASLSGLNATPLPDRYRQLKLSLVADHDEAQIVASWHRLLDVLRTENDTIARLGPDVIPSLRFSHLEEDLKAKHEELKKRGVAVVRGVIPRDEARAYKDQIEAYVAENKEATRGFPPENPQVYELYWSAAQLAARGHPHLVATQKRLMQALWHVSDPHAPVDISQPTMYADRLRIRQPGDARFALGPHQDGGSVERWEPAGYGLGKVYDEVFAGRWEDYDAWDAGKRAGAVCDLHAGLGACSVFRTFQGWLSISDVGPRQGTLLVYPLAKLATVYTLLRPFFRPKVAASSSSSLPASSADFLSAANWEFTGGAAMTSDLQGATPGHGQEFPEGPNDEPLHPHLELARTMVHVPQVAPGDFVVWHCDGIHAVDKVHNGTGDSSVLYIPVCPLTEVNARYLARQREAFLMGLPGPDFPGGKGESEHVNRPPASAIVGEAARQAMGLAPFVSSADASPGAQAITKKANAILGFP
ncbi:uncharacterized protein SPSK_10985 [Sporothrix schenckii 1099-18]|uniref:DUF1479 domain protein n=1 Tax=Sporothrix schenckii 1099-18 TaxID=1397361 RepID=A0A0F2M1L5_SPOSC|nr:uncharacterized protein SPSK_10985 [Sporothrix schenckii 1099-18]KJR83588.1 hypothetical protein SPSK_10985 [Sporothrix schenckii 1099-18]